jgi:hypothetical protein
LTVADNVTIAGRAAADSTQMTRSGFVEIANAAFRAIGATGAAPRTLEPGSAAG